MAIDATISAPAAGMVRRSAPVLEPFRHLIGIDPADPRVGALQHGVEPAFAAFDGAAWTGIDVTLRDPLPLTPFPDVAERWRTERLTEAVVDPSDVIAADVREARLTSLADVVTIGTPPVDHAEDLDFSDAAQVEECFFYLGDPLHRRRVNMLADVVVRLATAAVLERGSADVLEIGMGPSGVQRAAIARLDPTIRKRVRFIGVDVSSDLLAYGLHKGYLDKGIIADLAEFDAARMRAALGTPDVVIASEVFEHIQSSASVVKRGLVAWIGSGNGWLVGSVPNSVQGAEIAGIFRGDSAPHQLTRHLVDETTTHVSFYTYPTIRHALRSVWAAADSYVWGNGLRLDPQGRAVCLDGGLALPHRSDRLCFAARFNS